MMYSFFPVSVLKDFLETRARLWRKAPCFPFASPSCLTGEPVVGAEPQPCLRATAAACQGCTQVLNHQILPSRYRERVQQEGISQRLMASGRSLCQPDIQGESVLTMEPPKEDQKALKLRWENAMCHYYELETL